MRIILGTKEQEAGRHHHPPLDTFAWDRRLPEQYVRFGLTDEITYNGTLFGFELFTVKGLPDTYVALMRFPNSALISYVHEVLNLVYHTPSTDLAVMDIKCADPCDLSNAPLHAL